MTPDDHPSTELAPIAFPLLPIAVAELGEDAQTAFVEFFTAEIRNPNTRRAYLRAVCRYLDWTAEQRIELRQMRPFHVAAYIEQLQTELAAPSVKQHLSAIRMLGQYLVIHQILPTNPAASVRGPKHVVKTGKTPALENDDVKRLLQSIDTTTAAGLRDRALIGVMLYTFGRISAVLNLDVGDYFQVGRRMMVRFIEKGGKHHELPVHHAAIEYLDAYIAFLGDDGGPLFRSLDRSRKSFTGRRLDPREALSMVKRRCRRAGLGGSFCNHSFRATGVTAFLRNQGALEMAQYLAGHSSPRTTALYDRRNHEASLDEIERVRFT